MPSGPGVYLSFALWVPKRFAEVLGSLRDDFLVDLFGVLEAFGSTSDSFPRVRTLGSVFDWLVRNRDPLAPVRQKIRAFQGKWGA